MESPWKPQVQCCHLRQIPGPNEIESVLGYVFFPWNEDGWHLYIYFLELERKNEPFIYSCVSLHMLKTTCPFLALPLFSGLLHTI